MVKIKVKLENFEELKTKELLNKCHSFFIIVGSNENHLFYCQQWYDLKLLRSNGTFETKEIVIAKSLGLDTIYAHLISDSYVGLDVRCVLTPVLPADARSPPEPNWNNCSVSYSSVECPTEAGLDFSERCQHKCVNKSSCRHSCCKKWVTGDVNQTSFSDSQKQSVIIDRSLEFSNYRL